MLRFLFAIIFFLSVQQLSAQVSRTDLEKQRQNLLESIQQTKDQLAATQNDKKATLSQLRALQAKLSVRQHLISNINQDINSIDNNIHSSASEITQLQGNLEKQQVRFAQSVRYSYKFRNSYDMLAFLFSSGDFNDALRRMKYLKRYRDYRSEQLEQIKHTQGKIHNTIEVLNNQKTEKSELLTSQESQTQELQKETTEKDAVVKELKGREKELNEQIEKGQKSARTINQQINRLIQHEIEVARKRAEEEERRKREAATAAAEAEKKRIAAQQAAAQIKNNAGNGGVILNTGSGRNRVTASSRTETPATTDARTETRNNNATAVEAPLAPRSVNSSAMSANSYRMTLTPEVAAVSDNFEANRGRLPWPVEKGFISLGYGTYRHPTQKGITLDNYGINIDTAPGASVRAVFDGKVSNVFYVGSGWTVLVNHGIYYTVYNGLASVSVKKDQQVHTKQSIGSVGLNEEGVPQLQFQVWKAANKVDPGQWIAR